MSLQQLRNQLKKIAAKGGVTLRSHLPQGRERRYAPIWEAIKADALSKEPKGVMVNCSERLFPRIKKAVIKEKDVDAAFKDEGYRRLEFEFFVADPVLGTGIRFRLIDYRPLSMICNL